MIYDTLYYYEVRESCLHCKYYKIKPDNFIKVSRRRIRNLLVAGPDITKIHTQKRWLEYEFGCAAPCICNRFPPTPIILSSGQIDHKRPLLWPFEFCGEWQQSKISNEQQEERLHLLMAAGKDEEGNEGGFIHDDLLLHKRCPKYMRLWPDLAWGLYTIGIFSTKQFCESTREDMELLKNYIGPKTMEKTLLIWEKRDLLLKRK